MPNPADAILERLLDRLPSGQSHIHIDELSATGVPDFIIARIERDIHRKISAEFSLSDTIWTDVENTRLQNAWQMLRNAALKEAWLPLNEARRVFEPVGRETLDLLIRPRKMIAQVLFGSDSTLELEELEERTQSIFFHQQLVSAPLRYLSRKNLDSLSRSRCHQPIDKVDEQRCLRYNPAAWLAQLEPLIELSGGRLDPSLPAIFFQDKNRPRMSRKILESGSDGLTRADLMELLSGPELSGRPLTEEDRPGLFGARPMEVKRDWRAEEEAENRDLRQAEKDAPELEQRELEQPEQERPEFDRRGSERPEFDRRGLERPELERPGSERPKLERREVERQDPESRMRVVSRPDDRRDDRGGGLNPEQPEEPAARRTRNGNGHSDHRLTGLPASKDVTDPLRSREDNRESWFSRTEEREETEDRPWFSRFGTGEESDDSTDGRSLEREETEDRQESWFDRFGKSDKFESPGNRPQEREGTDQPALFTDESDSSDEIDDTGSSWFSRKPDIEDPDEDDSSDQVNLWERFLGGDTEEESSDPEPVDGGTSLASSFKEPESPGAALIEWLGRDASQIGRAS